MFDFKGNRINYYPSSLLNDASAHGDAQPVSEAPSNVASATTQFSNLNIEGKRTREDISKRNHFQQPGDRYRWFDPARRDRFINRIAEKVVGGPKVTKEIRERWFSYFDEMDPEAGQKLRKAVEGMAQA
jgi:catalase